MFEIKVISENCYEGMCFKDDFEHMGTSYEEIIEVMAVHEREIADLKQKNPKNLLSTRLRELL